MRDKRTLRHLGSGTLRGDDPRVAIGRCAGGPTSWMRSPRLMGGWLTDVWPSTPNKNWNHPFYGGLTTENRGC
jgi:hypothetical protein